ncbi:MAG: transcriptional regulator [Proteobacteria bacterium]|nr:transcriptional regulator [Pseudomonadota bacterium]MBU1059892.1 transcriptional regulator [Pseudomonadota bacterium]
MKHEKFFRKHPVFTGDEFTDHLSAMGKIGPRTRESLLNYHRNTGHVILIRRGLYAVIPTGSDPDSYPVDLFLVAAKITTDSVLSYHTALEVHGYAYSIREYHTYSATRPVPPVTFRSHVFRGVKFPQALCRAEKEDIGVITVDGSGLEVRVTCLERTLVDVLDRPDLSGSWEEIWRSLEGIEFFDLDQVVEYALLLGNATTIAKVGFYLEQHRESLMVEESHLKLLHEQRPRQPHYLDSSNRKSGKLVPDWNLVVPVDLFERTWGEVL